MPRADPGRRWPWTRLSIAMLVLLLAGTAMATPSLLDDYRTVLPLLQPERRAELLARARDWQSRTAAERDALVRRAAQWDALPRAERDVRRQHYQAWRALTPDERARLQALSRRVQAMPAEDAAALRAQFDALDASERRGWLLGPLLGADYPALQPLLAQVPPDQHAALLQVLRAMPAAQRADLAILVHRTPPQGRDALRRELVSTAAGQRERWLWERLGR